MRYPTLVPAFRAIARSIADDAVAEDIALGVDHRLYRQAAEFDDHLVAWGAFLTANEALERVRRGAAAALSPERLRALEALPAAALTVVVLRDGAGFSDDAIAVAVDRPLHEVRWLSSQLAPLAPPAQAGAPAPTAPAPTPPGVAAPPPFAGVAEPASQASAPEPRPTVLTPPTASAPTVSVPTPPTATVSGPSAAPAAAPRRTRSRTFIAIAAVAALLVVIVIAAVVGSNKSADRAERAKDPSDGAVVSDLLEGPQLNTAGCDSTTNASTLPPQELTIAGNGYSSRATLRAATPVDGPRPMVIVFVPPGFATGDWLATTRIEALAAQHGAVLATLEPSAAEAWNVPAGRELTTDLDALARLLTDVGAQTCVDPSRVTMIGFASAADFAMSVSCNYPRVASHVATVGGTAPNENCVRFDGRGLLAVLDGSLATYTTAVERVSAFIVQRSCPEPTYSDVAEFSLAISQACERNGQFWLAATAALPSWSAAIDDLVERFLTGSGAFDPPA